jgi:HEPN domain-containing protein
MADSTDYRRWVERIKQDLKLLGVIYNEGLEGMEDSFCYICHQAAEKLLKAFLVKYGKTTAPKTHDLVFLLGKCMKHESSLSVLENPLMILNEYAVSARYPGDFDDERTVEEARDAYVYLGQLEKEIMPFLNWC